MGAVLHYLDVLKPGGGLGVVIPHWQYAWRAHLDGNAWGHRWNTAPEVRAGMGRGGAAGDCGMRGGDYRGPGRGVAFARVNVGNASACGSWQDAGPRRWRAVRARSPSSLP